MSDGILLFTTSQNTVADDAVLDEQPLYDQAPVYQRDASDDVDSSEDEAERRKKAGLVAVCPLDLRTRAEKNAKVKKV